MKIKILLIAVLLLASCGTKPTVHFANETGPATSSEEWEKSWRCDGLTLYKTGSEGKVVIDGMDKEIRTEYKVSGLEQEWRWVDVSKLLDAVKNYDEEAMKADGTNPDTKLSEIPDLFENFEEYAVILGQGPTGLAARYYDFRMADENGKAKPKTIFWNCSK